MTQLYIIRHGETIENAAGILQGHLPGQLSPKGIRMAAETEVFLHREIQPQRIISSDLKRATDTAKLLNAHWQLPIEQSPLLRERHWGSYTGLEIKALPQGDFPPSVETVPQMLHRAATFLQSCRESCTETLQQHPVLVVSHGVFLRCLQAIAEQRPLHEIPHFQNLEYRRLLLPEHFDAYHAEQLLRDVPATANDRPRNGRED